MGIMRIYRPNIGGSIGYDRNPYARNAEVRCSGSSSELTYDDDYRIIAVEETTQYGLNYSICGQTGQIIRATSYYTEGDVIIGQSGANSEIPTIDYEAVPSGDYSVAERNGNRGILTPVIVASENDYVKFGTPTSDYNVKLNTDIPLTLANDRNRFMCCRGNQYYGSACEGSTFIDYDNYLSFSLSEGMDFPKSVMENIYNTVREKVNILTTTYSAPKIAQARNSKVYGIYITKDATKANIYLNGGDLPDDAYMNDIPSEDESDEPPEPSDDVRHSKDEYDELKSNTLSNSPIFGGVNYYVIDENDLSSFLSWMNSQGDDITEILKNAFTGVYSSLSENVISIKTYLGDFNNFANGFNHELIKLGFMNSDVTSNRITSFVNSTQNFGDAFFTNRHNSFYDYSPYTVASMYLPFVGWFDVDVNIWMGQTMGVRYRIDPISGNISYYLMRGNTCIDIKCGKCMVDIPFKTLNIGDYTSNLISNDLGKLSTATSGNPFTSLNGILTPPPPPTMSGSMSNGDMNIFINPMKGYYLLETPVYKRPSSYGRNIGFPIYDSYYLDELSGFTVLENPVLNFGNNKPTSNEIEEIYTLLKEGVYL